MSPRDTAIDVFRNSVLFSITLHSWGNRAKVDQSQYEVDAEKDMTRMTATLLDCKEYKRIRSVQFAAKEWCKARCVPSFMRDGFFLVKVSEIESFEAFLVEQQGIVQNELVPALLAVYEERRTDAKRKLNGIVDNSRYPTPSELGDAFGIEWSWLRFQVPDVLPPAVRKKEAARLRESYQNAAKEITVALRAGFQEMVAYAIDKLQPDEDGSPKPFRDRAVTRFADFFDTFNARNLLDDKELADVVAQARGILANVRPEDVKDSARVRRTVKEQLSKVKTVVDELVKDGGRKFSFDD